MSNRVRLDWCLVQTQIPDWPNGSVDGRRKNLIGEIDEVERKKH